VNTYKLYGKNNNKIIIIIIIIIIVIEIQRMWNVKATVIPVIRGATGTISKSLRRYLSNIPGKHEIDELQKTAILGTAHILRKVLT
jgi:hypothetical protein